MLVTAEMFSKLTAPGYLCVIPSDSWDNKKYPWYFGLQSISGCAWEEKWLPLLVQPIFCEYFLVKWRKYHPQNMLGVSATFYKGNWEKRQQHGSLQTAKSRVLMVAQKMSWLWRDSVHPWLWVEEWLPGGRLCIRKHICLNLFCLFILSPACIGVIHARKKYL